MGAERLGGAGAPPSTRLKLTILLPDYHRLSANSSSQEHHFSRSLADRCQLSPFDLMNLHNASSHLIAGLPHARLPACGSQSSSRVDHPRSPLCATCPAHLHFRRLCSSTQSTTPTFLAALTATFMALAIHSFQLSSSSPSFGLGHHARAA